jgi:hypothetical protein
MAGPSPTVRISKRMLTYLAPGGQTAAKEWLTPESVKPLAKISYIPFIINGVWPFFAD